MHCRSLPRYLHGGRKKDRSPHYCYHTSPWFISYRINFIRMETIPNWIIRECARFFLARNGIRAEPATNQNLFILCVSVSVRLPGSVNRLKKCKSTQQFYICEHTFSPNDWTRPNHTRIKGRKKAWHSQSFWIVHNTESSIRLKIVICKYVMWIMCRKF